MPTVDHVALLEKLNVEKRIHTEVHGTPDATIQGQISSRTEQEPDDDNSQ